MKRYGYVLSVISLMLAIVFQPIRPTQAQPIQQEAVAAACTHYLDSNSPAGGNGSAGAPWNEIKASYIAQLVAGNVLCIRGNTSGAGRVYYSAAEISIDSTKQFKNGTSNAPITVQVYPGEKVILQTGDQNVLEFRNVSYWVWDGFILDRQGQTNSTLRFKDTSYTTVKNCEAYNGKVMGVVIDGGQNNTLENCKIHDFKGPANDDTNCISIQKGKFHTIRNNEIYNCTGDGVLVYDAAAVSGTVIEGNHIYTTLGGCSENALDIKMGGAEQTVVRRNKMHGFRVSTPGCGGTGGGIGEAVLIHLSAQNVLVDGNEIYDSVTGIVIGAGSGHKLVNNVIHDLATNNSVWENIGVYLSDGASIVIINNTFANLNPAKTTLFIGKSIPGLQVRNNIFANTGKIERRDGGSATFSNNGWYNAAQTSSGAGDVVAAPGFVSSTDFRLLGNSPMIDKGTSSGAPSTDFDGTPRPTNNGIDIGAFEFPGPLPVNTLQISSISTSSNSADVTLKWKVPGLVGQASSTVRFELRYATQGSNAQQWNNMTVLDANIPPAGAGTNQQLTVTVPWTDGEYRYFLLRAYDGNSFASPVSNLVFWPKIDLFLPVIRR
jgi:parallel beta-helix repeat protein